MAGDNVTTAPELPSLNDLPQTDTTQDLQAAGPRVRPYNAATDRQALRSLFGNVYHSTYKYADLTTIAFIIWCRAYLDLAPKTCFVLDNGTADQIDIVGYLAGTPSSRNFCKGFATVARTDIEATAAAPSREEMRDPTKQGGAMDYLKSRSRYVAALDRPESLVFDVAEDFLDDWPAHFHMAIAPEWQGRGLGPDLVAAFTAEIRQQGVKGLFVAVPDKAAPAKKMYEKLEFGRLQVELDRGESGEMGVTAGTDRSRTVYYILDLATDPNLDEAVVLE